MVLSDTLELTEKERRLIECLRELPPFGEYDFTVYKHEGVPVKIEVDRLREKRQL